jgi:hypothetical protein
VLPSARERLLSARSSSKRKAVKGFRDVSGEVPDLGAATAKAQTASQARQQYAPEAPQYPPANEYFDPQDLNSVDYATRQGGDLEPPYEPDNEQPVVAPPARCPPPTAALDEEHERKNSPLSYTILPEFVCSGGIHRASLRLCKYFSAGPV